MWMILGLAAIAATVLHLYRWVRKRTSQLWGGVALALTAFTLCAEYSLLGRWAAGQDWAALMDVAPTMSWALWVVTTISVVLNLVPMMVNNRE